MSRPRGRAESGRACAAVALALLGCACSRDRLPGGLLAREALLERQIDELSMLGRAAERGGFLPRDKLVVAVSERLANALAALALPREQVVAGRYRVRLETAEVRFRAEHGSVRFDGRLSPVESLPQDFVAQLALFGAVDTVELERSTGVLRCNVSIVGFELTHLEVQGAAETGRLLLAELGRQGVDALKALAFPLEIPVRLEQEIALKGVSGEGPVRLRPSSLPLRLAVADVAAHAGRLWVAVEVSPSLRKRSAERPAGVLR